MYIEKQYVKECVAVLGKAIGGTRPKAKALGLSVEDERRIWKQILLTVANGGGKYEPSR